MGNRSFLAAWSAFRARFLRLFFLRGEANAGLADGSVCGKRSAKPDADLYGRPDAAHASGVRRPAAGRFVRLYLLFFPAEQLFFERRFRHCQFGDDARRGALFRLSPFPIARGAGRRDAPCRGRCRRAGQQSHLRSGAEGIRSTLAALDEAGLLHTAPSPTAFRRARGIL